MLYSGDHVARHYYPRLASFSASNSSSCAERCQLLRHPPPIRVILTVQVAAVKCHDLFRAFYSSVHCRFFTVTVEWFSQLLRTSQWLTPGDIRWETQRVPITIPRKKGYADLLDLDRSKPSIIDGLGKPSTTTGRDTTRGGHLYTVRERSVGQDLTVGDKLLGSSHRRMILPANTTLSVVLDASSTVRWLQQQAEPRCCTSMSRIPRPIRSLTCNSVLTRIPPFSSRAKNEV